MIILSFCVRRFFSVFICVNLWLNNYKKTKNILTNLSYFGTIQQSIKLYYKIWVTKRIEFKVNICFVRLLRPNIWSIQPFILFNWLLFELEFCCAHYTNSLYSQSCRTCLWENHQPDDFSPFPRTKSPCFIPLHPLMFKQTIENKRFNMWSYKPH